MKKLTTSIFILLLLLIPSISYSSGNNTTEKEDLKKVTAPPPKNNIPQKPQQGKLGKFKGIDEKRDVALYEDTSKEPFLKRLKNLFWGKSSTPRTPKKP